MKFKNKKLMLTLLLFIFISSITVVNAVDVSDNVTSTDYQVSTVETISVDEQQVDEYNNIESNVNEAKEITNNEYDKFRPRQDKNYRSNFDKQLENIQEIK